MRRLLLSVSAAVLLAGCAGTGGVAGGQPSLPAESGSSAPATVSPSPTTSGFTPPTSSPPIPPWLPPEQVVFQVRVEGGYVPQLATALTVPSVTVHGDGTVYVSEPDDRWGVPPRILVGHSDPTTVATLAADVAAGGLLTRDFGTPGVTDNPDTTVSLHSAAGDQVGRAYALEFSVDYRAGLSDDQIEWRAQLRALIDELRSLAADASEWAPEQVRVLKVPYGNEPTGSDPLWPGPDIAQAQGVGWWTDGCLGVTEGAADLYAAARTNPAAIWTTPYGPMTLAVVAVLPGEPLC